MSVEEVDGDAPDVVWAEGIGVGVSGEHADGPLFVVALNAPGGGKVMWSTDAIGALEYAASLVATVTDAMKNWESK
jgi:hypothetical protein